MKMDLYLLKLTDLSCYEEELLLGLLPEQRRETALRRKKGAARLSAIGTGLLLRYALTGRESDGRSGMHVRRMIAGGDLIAGLQKQTEPVSFSWRFGEKGKPYFAEEGLPYFSISHSGDYAAVMISDHECGIDMQRMEEKDTFRLAERFFCTEEAEYVRQEGPDGFYRLWCRKEALGKCTGEGLTPWLTKNVINQTNNELSGYVCYEYDGIDGYRIAACLRRREDT